MLISPNIQLSIYAQCRQGIWILTAIYYFKHSLAVSNEWKFDPNNPQRKIWAQTRNLEQILSWRMKQQ